VENSEAQFWSNGQRIFGGIETHVSGRKKVIRIKGASAFELWAV
jgi:hypothetical protein